MARLTPKRAAASGLVTFYHRHRVDELVVTGGVVTGVRGTRLAEGAGHFDEGSMRCRYHAWRYDLDGRLVDVVDREEYLASTREIGAAYRAVMGDHYPAMAVVEVAGLLEPQALVEIEATAVVPA